MGAATESQPESHTLRTLNLQYNWHNKLQATVLPHLSQGWLISHLPAQNISSTELS